MLRARGSPPLHHLLVIVNPVLGGPPRWPGGKAFASRAEDPMFESPSLTSRLSLRSDVLHLRIFFPLLPLPLVSFFLGVVVVVVVVMLLLWFIMMMMLLLLLFFLFSSSSSYRLVGLVVRRPPRGRKIPGSLDNPWRHTARAR